MKFEPINCRCIPHEKELTCNSCDGDYDIIEIAKKEKKEPLHVPPRNEEERKKLEEYNEKMKEICPDFEPLPLTEEEYKQMIHEKAAATCGGIENLNFAKALVGEKTPNNEELLKIIELVKNAGYSQYEEGPDGKPRPVKRRK